GLGGASALLVAIIAALVVLPALLSLVGHKINKWSFGRKKSDNKEEHSIWIKTGAFTLKHPVLTLLVSGLVILTIAAPFRHVNFINLDYRSLAPSSSSYKVAESLTNDFSGQSPSINVVYEIEDPAQNLAEV